MQEKIEFLSYIFIECMVFDGRVFSEKDFKELLKTQRLDDSYEYFNDNVEDALNAFSYSDYNRKYILDKDNFWKPAEFESLNPEYNISKIISSLQLHLMPEFSQEDFYSISCDVVNKVNDYIDLFLIKETIYD